MPHCQPKLLHASLSYVLLDAALIGDRITYEIPWWFGHGNCFFERGNAEVKGSGRHALRLYCAAHRRAAPARQVENRDHPRHGDRVLVGLNTGALRIYRLNELPPQNCTALAPPATESSGEAPSADTNGKSRPSSGGQPTPKPAVKPTDLLREVEKFSTRAIEQLAIIKEANTLVSLSNYHVSLHDLQSYEPIGTLACTKNASKSEMTTFGIGAPVSASISAYFSINQLY
ncbi:uncharacterized protein B0I36DRAFT_353364 [Microdochium trichocladiopsis]|uniref:Uncharacterized protein n=1 Tax=Microdochium trichocladiopsis TaxID=1682393 RepID=A0A9P8Y1P7_9PEZI|nr:uncharacterized protein B0I36DRAFT_353364 [Microdochium trichocladiopsis]KAH7025221.1 hypothetical protein B0I36DRAFT_353364 [Microdochium trichocladiopsis]